MEWREEEGGCLKGGWTLLFLVQGGQDSVLVVMQNKYPGAKHEKHKLSSGGLWLLGCDHSVDTPLGTVILGSSFCSLLDPESH